MYFYRKRMLFRPRRDKHLPLFSKPLAELACSYRIRIFKPLHLYFLRPSQITHYIKTQANFEVTYPLPAARRTHENMQIRTAQRSDLTPAAKVCAKAFFDTELFGEVIHPYRHQYPDDMHLYWLKNFRSGLNRKDNYILVATVSEPEESQPKIVGVAQWIRRRTRESNEDQSSSTSSEQNKAEEEQEELPPNRAADPAKLNVLQRVGPFVDHKWSGTQTFKFLPLSAIISRSDLFG